MKMIVQDLAIEYQDSGTGPVLLFLHGWGDSLHTFDALIPSVKEEFRLVRLDLPGFGGSEAPREAWDVKRYAECVTAFLAKLSVSPYAVIGHSLGGRIAIKGQGSGPLFAEKIVLIASAGIAREQTMGRKLALLVVKTGGLLFSLPGLNRFKEKMRRNLYRSLESDYYDAGVLRETLVNVVKEDLRNDAARISVPTLCIWGSDDRATPVEQGRLLTSQIQGSRFKVIAGAGHFVHQEKPEEVAKLINAFL